MAGSYTSQIQAGLGIEETRVLLELWQEGMRSGELFQAALQSGRFPRMSARRLQNMVKEGFAPRYLRDDGAPARLLNRLKAILVAQEWQQMLFIYSCRANLILADFVREVYWPAYAAGRQALTGDDARDFVTQANQEGKTAAPWSESTIVRVASYLTGSCADFGLLERGSRSERRIVPFRIERRVAALLAYDLHWSGLGDNRIVHHEDWMLFGMEAPDVVEELKRLAVREIVIVQHGGGVTHIGWLHPSLEELLHVIARI